MHSKTHVVVSPDKTVTIVARIDVERERIGNTKRTTVKRDVTVIDTAGRRAR